MTKNLKWNCFEFSEKHYFELIFLLQLAMRSFLRQRLMLMSAKLVAKNSLLLLLIVWLLKSSLYDMNLIENVQLTQLLIFSWSVFAKSTFILWNNINFLKCFRCIFAVCIDNSRCQNVDYTMYLDWFSVNFIEREFFIVVFVISCIAFVQNSIVEKMFVQIVVLRSYDFLIVRFCWSRHVISWWKYFAMFLLKSSFDQFLKISWYFDFWCFAIKTKRSKSSSSNDFSLIWMKIHFAWMFRQFAQTFSMILIFWICRYCYE